MLLYVFLYPRRCSAPFALPPGSARRHCLAGDIPGWSIPPPLQVGVRGKNVIVLGVEKKSTAKLQEARTVRKIVPLDSRICVAFAGLTADARVLLSKARRECQSYRLTVEDSPSVEYVTRYLAGVQQKYTQSGGVRPFGISTLVVGFDADGTGRLFQTDPSGTFSEWSANAIGRHAKTVVEYLEKSQPAAMDAAAAAADDAAAKQELVKLAVRSLLEVVESSAKNIEVAVVTPDKGLQLLSEADVEAIVVAVEEEKKAADEAKKGKGRAGSLTRPKPTPPPAGAPDASA